MLIVFHVLSKTLEVISSKDFVSFLRSLYLMQKKKKKNRREIPAGLCNNTRECASHLDFWVKSKQSKADFANICHRNVAQFCT